MSTSLGWVVIHLIYRAYPLHLSGAHKSRIYCVIHYLVEGNFTGTHFPSAPTADVRIYFILFG